MYSMYCVLQRFICLFIRLLLTKSALRSRPPITRFGEELLNLKIALLAMEAIKLSFSMTFLSVLQASQLQLRPTLGADETLRLLAILKSKCPAATAENLLKMLILSSNRLSCKVTLASSSKMDAECEKEPWRTTFQQLSPTERRKRILGQYSLFSPETTKKIRARKRAAHLLGLSAGSRLALIGEVSGAGGGPCPTHDNNRPSPPCCIDHCHIPRPRGSRERRPATRGG